MHGPMRVWGRLIGRRRRHKHSTPPFCEVWIGILVEENAKRCKPSYEGQRNVTRQRQFALLDLIHPRLAAAGSGAASRSIS
jgi:hypothetical protein